MKAHNGAGCLIRNASKTLFFVQVKDETYPIEKWRGAYSLWGGAVEEKDKSPEEALRRELSEELPDFPAEFQVQFLLDYLLKNQWVNKISFFELILPDTVFDEYVVAAKVLEGVGVPVKSNKLLQKDWVLDIDPLIKAYLEGTLEELNSNINKPI